MATFDILAASGLTPASVFPSTGITQEEPTATEKSYTYGTGSASRTIVVIGTDGGSGTITTIQTVRLYGADGATVLAEFTGVDNVALADFEQAWLTDTASPNDVFSLLLGGGSVLNGGNGDDRFVGGTGDDTINGYSDFINFTTIDYVDYSHRDIGIIVDLDDGDDEDSAGKVTIEKGGTVETDTLNGIGGVYATAFDDRMTGDAYDNEFWGGFGNDIIDGGDGFDMISYRGLETRTNGIQVTFDSAHSGIVAGGAGEIDSFTNVEFVYGTDKADSFKGAEGYQRFRGFGGNDTFDGGAGDDEVDYRSDTAEVAGKAGINLNLSSVNAQGVVTVAGANGDVDTLISIERIRGTRNNDTITGSNGSNRLRGDAGSDALNGLNGDDTLEGGNGHDNLDGGDGRDLLLGDAGNDVLLGGAGFADTMEGGAGNDTIYGGAGTGGASNTNDRAAYNLGSIPGELGIRVVSETEAYITLTDGGQPVDIFSITRTTSTTATFIVQDLRDGSPLGTDTVSNVDEMLFYFPGRPNDSFRLQIGVSVYQHQDQQGYNIYGGFLDNTINANLIVGLKQTDSVNIFAEDGNDTITGHNGDNGLNGGDGNDVINAGGGINYVEADAGNDTVNGGTGWGDSMNYILPADTNGTLDVDQGEDTIIFTRTDGGVVHTLVTATRNQDGSWTVDARNIGYGIDTLTNVDAINISIGGNFEDPAKFTGATFGIIAYGDPNNDGYIVGGTAGDDTFNINESVVSPGIVNKVVTAYGHDGDDHIVGHNGANVLLGDEGNDTLLGAAGWDTLDGGNGNDLLIGGIGNLTDEDYFLASNGNDTIYGGSEFQGDNSDFNWNEIRYFDSGFGSIEVQFGDNGGPGTVQKKNGSGSVVGTDTFSAIQAILGTNGADTFRGGDTYGVQRFVGYKGNDTFDGTKGVNEVDYRTEARVLGITTGITVDLGSQNTATVTDLSGNTDTLTLIERVRGTEQNDTVRGNGLNNRLRGDKGNDIIDGRDGDDRLEGGDGNDTITGGLGNDTLQDGAGNDTVNGGFGDDYFEVGGGDDTIDGGGGDPNPDAFNDISYRNTASAGIVVDFDDNQALAGVVTDDGSGGQDTFTNINAVHGSQFGDSFKGGTGNYRFIGHGGNDTFEGSLDSNAEVDYRSEARAAGRTVGMTIDLAAGQVLDATGGVDTLINIKRARGTDHADIIYGNDLNNRLRGDGGNDLLRGGAGNDDLQGGAGADTIIYSGNRSNYRVTINGTTLTVADQRNGADGTDTVIDAEFFNFGGTILNLAEVLNYGSGIGMSNGVVAENSAAGTQVGTLTVANPDAASNYTKYALLNDAGGRFMIGADGKSIVVKNGILLDYEQAATHRITVQAIDEALNKSITYDLTVVLQNVDKENTTGTTGSDTVSGGASSDTLAGGGGNDVLDAGAGKDKVEGGIGNDRLIGGGGQDTLSGGAGKDVFAFGAKDTGTSKGTADTITDFKGREGDRLDLKLIDADVKKKGDQAFSFIGKTDFTKAGQVRYEKAGKDTYVYLNTDSDKAAEAVIKLKGAIDLQKGWFVL